MASSDQTKCSTDVNEETRNACCSPCSDEGSYTAAGHYCVDCEMYFCTKCVKCHNKIPSTKSHQVNDVESSDSTNAEANDETNGRVDFSTETMRCTLHQDKQIDTYCPDHDKVCCGTCAVVKHRLCSTESIAKASKDFQSSPIVNECKDTLIKVLIQLKDVKENRTENIDRVGKQKLELIEYVDKYEERIIAKVKELANISRQEIRSKYEEYRTALEKDVAALNGAMTTTTTYVDKLERTSNEPLLFATTKTSKKITQDGEMLLQAMLKECTDEKLEFQVNKTLEMYIDGMESLGVFEDGCTAKEYKATLQNNVKVTTGNESNTSIDTCLIDCGDLLLVDHQNFKLKRYNSYLQFKDEIKLSSYPIAVCKIAKHEVAVRIWNSKVVHFVSVGKSMQLTSSFTLAANGYGMTYDAETEEIFACEGNKVSVYSKTGNMLRTYDKDTNCEPMFQQCRQIALSPNKKEVYVTDGKYVVVLDKNGRLKMKVSTPGIDDNWPLCLLPGNIFLTGSRSSGVIVQIDKDGKQVGTLIDTKDERTFTYCAVYDREYSRLIVGGYPGVISVYTMSSK